MLWVLRCLLFFVMFHWFIVPLTHFSIFFIADLSEWRCDMAFDYFGRFSIKISGVIYSGDITPEILSRKSAQKNQKSGMVQIG